MSELVINAATMSCCGSPRGECRCRPVANADDESTQQPTNRESNVKNRKGATRNRATIDTQMKTCPASGGNMKNGECEDCGHEEGMATANAYEPAPGSGGIVINANTFDNF